MVYDFNTCFFYKTKYIRTQGFSGKKVKNMLRTYQGFEKD